MSVDAVLGAVSCCSLSTPLSHVRSSLTLSDPDLRLDLSSSSKLSSRSSSEEQLSWRIFLLGLLLTSTDTSPSISSSSSSVDERLVSFLRRVPPSSLSCNLKKTAYLVFILPTFHFSSFVCTCHVHGKKRLLFDIPWWAKAQNTRTFCHYNLRLHPSPLMRI